MPRLFVAIDLPEQLKATLAGFTPELPAAGWVVAEDLHLTLRFIGEVDQETFSSIRTALSGIDFAAFPLTLRSVGHFPPGKRPRVLWIGMDRCDQLIQLQQEVELALTETGLPVEERPFSPHITIARLKETLPEAVTRFETRHCDFACPAFEVSEFILYSSILTRQGAIHTREAVYRCR